MRNKKGFTLVEALISVIILAITLAGGIQLLFNADKITSVTIRKKIAIELANTEMEVIRSAPFGPPFVNNTTSIVIGGLVGQITSIQDGVDVNGNVGPPPHAFKKIDLEVLWPEVDEGAPRRHKIVTYLAP